MTARAILVIGACILLALSACSHAADGTETPASGAASASAKGRESSSTPVVGGPSTEASPASQATSSPNAPATPAAGALVVAWQPSHQDDTGFNGWHEYRVCKSIAKRAMAELPEVRHILAWETGMGLTGTNNYRPSPTNTRAFDSELARANRAGADVFLAVHVNGGAPSSQFAEVMPGDERSEAVAKRIVKALEHATGIPSQGVLPMRLYSLEPERNEAPIRILLEIGDNEADRDYLMNPAGREEIAAALADVIRTLKPSGN